MKKQKQFNEDFTSSAVIPRLVCGISQRGFTLLELLIATTLGSLLMILLLQTYLSALQTYQYQRALSRLQQQQYFLLHYFDHVFSLAGFAGCYREHDPIPVRIYHGETIKTLPGNIQQRILPDSDVLEIEYLDSRVDVIATTTSNHIITTPLLNIPLKDIQENALMISDCEHHEYFFLKDIQMSNEQSHWTTENALKYEYHSDATVGQWRRVLFYIAKTNRFDTQHQPIIGLYEDDLKSTPLELEEGIDALHLAWFGCHPINRCLIKINIILNSHLILPEYKNKGLKKTWEGIFALSSNNKN